MHGLSPSLAHLKGNTDYVTERKSMQMKERDMNCYCLKPTPDERNIKLDKETFNCTERRQVINVAVQRDPNLRFHCLCFENCIMLFVVKVHTHI